jgi:cysteine desulfurase / selenocysteine lyase
LLASTTKKKNKKFRQQIPALSGMTYLDNAGAGLPPRSVTDGMKELIDDWSRTGEHWDEWLLDVVEARRLFAKLVGGATNSIGVIPSVSVGLAAVGSSVKMSKKKLVTSNLNFPTNVIMWQRMKEAGLVGSVTLLEHTGGLVPLEAYEQAIDDQTALVAVDYVSWLSGAREHVRGISDLAHKHGALLVVDSFHALGVFPIDVKADGIDVLISGFYKWLCGPHGVACVCVDEDMLESMVPPYLGWLGVEGNVVERFQAGRDPFDVPFSLKRAPPSRSAARFEWGTWATVAVKGAIESMKFTLRSDPAMRFKAIAALKARLFEGLEQMGVKMLTPPVEVNPGGGIVTFESKRQSEVVGKLAKQKIMVSGRFGHVRISPHFYNTAEEVDRFLGAARTLVSTR